MPSGGHSEQQIKDALRSLDDCLQSLERGQAALAAQVADLAEQLAEVMEAEAILRRSQMPGAARHRASQPGRRRGDTALRVVKAFAVATAGLGLLLAMALPQKVSRQDCYLQHSGAMVAGQCWRPIAHRDADPAGGDALDHATANAGSR